MRVTIVEMAIAPNGPDPEPRIVAEGLEVSHHRNLSDVVASIAKDTVWYAGTTDAGSAYNDANGRLWFAYET